MKKALLLLCGVVLCAKSVQCQQLSATSLVLTGPQNSQEVGGVGSAGDSSCPGLSSLISGQYAICYLQADGALELGYPNGTYSPFVRMSDLQTAEAVMAAQVATLTQQVSSLQSQLNTVVTTISQTQSSAPTTILDVVMNGALIPNSSFSPLPLVTVNLDTASAFNRNTSAYIIPSTGYYLVITKMRLSDGLPSNINYGQNAGTQLGDGPAFVWSSTGTNSYGPSRNGSVNVSVTHYNQGDQVRMYAYLDYYTLLPMNYAEMTVIKVGN